MRFPRVERAYIFTIALMSAFGLCASLRADGPYSMAGCTPGGFSTGSYLCSELTMHMALVNGIEGLEMNFTNSGASDANFLFKTDQANGASDTGLSVTSDSLSSVANTFAPGNVSTRGGSDPAPGSFAGAFNGTAVNFPVKAAAIQKDIVNDPPNNGQTPGGVNPTPEPSLSVLAALAALVACAGWRKRREHARGSMEI
jgi:hypothetical protein